MTAAVPGHLARRALQIWLYMQQRARNVGLDKYGSEACYSDRVSERGDSLTHLLTLRGSNWFRTSVTMTGLFQDSY